MRRFLLIVLILLLIGTGVYLYLNRSDRNEGTSPPVAGAPPSTEVLAHGK